VKEFCICCAQRPKNRSRSYTRKRMFFGGFFSLTSYGENPRTKTVSHFTWDGSPRRRTDVVTSVEETLVTSWTLHPCCAVNPPSHPLLLEDVHFIGGYGLIDRECCQGGSVFVAADSYAIACVSR